jgi:hypothetical protein
VGRVILLWSGGHDRQLSAPNRPDFELSNYVWFYNDARNPATTPDYSDTDHAYFYVQDGKREDNVQRALRSGRIAAVKSRRAANSSTGSRMSLDIYVSSIDLSEQAAKSLPVLISNLRPGGKWNKPDEVANGKIVAHHRFPWGVISQDLFSDDQYRKFVEAVISLNRRSNQFNYSLTE